MEADGLLIGRKTYERFAGAWPEREAEFADKFNEMPKFVVRRRRDPEWNNTTVLDSGDATAQVTELKRELDGPPGTGVEPARPPVDRERPG